MSQAKEPDYTCNDQPGVGKTIEELQLLRLKRMVINLVTETLQAELPRLDEEIGPEPTAESWRQRSHKAEEVVDDRPHATNDPPPIAAQPAPKLRQAGATSVLEALVPQRPQGLPPWAETPNIGGNDLVKRVHEYQRRHMTGVTKSMEELAAQAASRLANELMSLLLLAVRRILHPDWYQAPQPVATSSPNLMPENAPRPGTAPRADMEMWP